MNYLLDTNIVSEWVRPRPNREVIAWLAAQPWCTGKVGMFGTSYSGFNALQMAAERPPALAAICAIYASDDRYTDDVHYHGGCLPVSESVAWAGRMVALNALPPLPEVVGEHWYALWRERLFAWTNKSSESAMEFFKLPTNRVVELGSQLQI